MSKLYFIDHESIKKTAKAIKKQNEKHNYTYILDELTKCLGYKSYNEYEHYLTNAFLNSQNKLQTLIPLTQLTIPELISLNNNIIDKLISLNIITSCLFFVDKIITSKVEEFKSYKRLSLKSYLYYLPFIFNVNKEIIYDKENFFELVEVFKKYYLNSPLISFREGEYFLTSLTSDLKELAKNDLKIRPIYYLSLSMEEGIVYEESILLKAVLKNDDNEIIYEEVKYALTCLERNKPIQSSIPNFSSCDIKQDYNLFFPYIKNNSSDENPLILGLSNDSTPLFFNKEELFKNTFICGRPGSGRNVIKQTIALQILMNNRGFLNIDGYPHSISKNRSYEEKRIEYLSSLFNQQDNTFLYGINDINLLFQSINNNKIINLSLLGHIHNYDAAAECSLSQLTTVLNNISNNYYYSKFRKHRFPYYIFIDEFRLADLNGSIYRVIKNLNNIGIYIIFFSDSFRNYDPIFENVIIPNSDTQYLIDKHIPLNDTPSDLFGIGGPSKHGVSFSHYVKMNFKQQFWTHPTQSYMDYEEIVRMKE